MTDYKRVIPRDLFNESKLLKCLGQLCLIIHEGKDDGGYTLPEGFEVRHDPELGFLIQQFPGDGSLYCANLRVIFRGRGLGLSSRYNSRDPYPLAVIDDEQGDINIFNDDGTISYEFQWWLQQIEQEK